MDNWDNTAQFKLIDFIMTVPEGITVTEVSSGDRLFGGSVSYHLDTDGKLRCVYFDTNENSDITISGTEFPAQVFNISFKIEEEITADKLTFAITGMSVKYSSDSYAEDGSMVVVKTEPKETDPENPGSGSGGGSGDVEIVVGVTYSAVELYKGDDIDLIPSTKKAVAIAVTGIDEFSTLVYNDGTNEIQFQYSSEITAETKIPTFVALVDASISMANFVNKDYLTINGTGIDASNILFGDTNADAAVNAQDALNVVNAWLRKDAAPTDSKILRMNVNGDSRINTYDALGIVEAYISGSDYGVVTRAANVANTANK